MHICYSGCRFLPVKVREISQVAIVVKNLEEAMKKYWETLGLGPWSIYTFAPPRLKDTYVRGKPVKYSMRLAITMVGNVMVELIEPLEGPSIYKEFLETKGEGLHHIACFKYNSLEEVKRDLEEFEKMGIKVLQSGRFDNIYYYYLDTEPILGIIYEIGYIPMPLPEPERIWPPKEGKREKQQELK